ncbi:MAG TPA: tetratricopeptide repeat protein, partial [Candidatus Nitrosotenuis sp.]|nr:tetratricopeptide repeat protein [Candidatus Nitrosotenuis sp.]
YQQALALEPNNVEYQSNLGLALSLKGDHGKALELLKPLGHSPQATPKHRHNLAFAYGLAGNEQQARALYSQDLSESNVASNLQTIQRLRASLANGLSTKPLPAPSGLEGS